MNNAVLIKSFSNGISIQLEEDVPFEELLAEIEDKFADSARFFRGNKLALSLEGRSLTAEEEKQIVKTVAAKGELNIVCLIGRDEEKEELYVRAVRQVTPHKEEENPLQFYRGTISGGQTVESKKSMIVLGDVEAGCRVISEHDIIVIGALNGEAFAGSSGDEGHFVAALSMHPEKLKIAELKYRDEEKKFFRKKGKQPQLACVKDGHIVVQDITKELLNGLGKTVF